MMKTGVGILLLYSHKLLLLLRDDKPNIPNPLRWSFVGGGIEEGETPLQAACRETHEEVHLTPVLTEIVTSSKGNTFFYAEISGQEVARLEEGCAYGWFSIDALRALDALGDVKGGLGGALKRTFMRHPNEMDALINRGVHPPLNILEE